MQLTLKDQSGGPAESTIDIADVIAGAEFNEALVHQVVTAYMAGARSGTKAQKTRAQVRGGGAKPWKQKGLGRARAGSIRSPIWRGGGVTFAATPRNYAQKVNKKMYRSAMRSILSELIRQDRLMVLEDLSISAPKTKELVSRLEALGTNDVLIVTAEVDETLELAARNLYWAAVVSSSELNPVSLLAFQKVAMTAPAMKMLEERLS